MMTFFALQRSTGERLLVNIDNVTHVEEIGDGTCLIHFVGDEAVVPVQESRAHIIGMIERFVAGNLGGLK